MKNPLSGIIFSQNGMRYAEKEGKKLSSWIPKKIAKKFKKLKNLIPALFFAETGWDRPRKGEKKFSPEFSLYTARERKFRKK